MWVYHIITVLMPLRKTHLYNWEKNAALHGGMNQDIPTHCSRHGATVSDFELPDKEM
jgi:hypothetical protein